MISRVKYVFKLSNYTIDPKDETYFALLGILITVYAYTNLPKTTYWYSTHDIFI